MCDVQVKIHSQLRCFVSVYVCACVNACVTVCMCVNVPTSVYARKESVC